MSGHILLTGGAGYIGSHICVQLLEAGYEVTIIDNFCNSYPECLRRIALLTNWEVTLIEADLATQEGFSTCEAALAGKKIDGTVHLAGLKAVGESVAKPASYYHTNINSTLNLIHLLSSGHEKRIVFSSSATVYGEAQQNPVTEQESCKPTNPYGRTKYFIEQILSDLYAADPDWQIVNLRYFNPVGAHVSGMIGEDPQGIPNNLFPFVAQVAAGVRDEIGIFGNDYPTTDGTGIRDYIHVEDLAAGHLAAIKWLATLQQGCAENFNLGTGRGYSVLEVIRAFSKAASKNLPYRFAPRREGDIAEIYADATRAGKELGWQPKHDLDQMCADHWRWQHQNPTGYLSKS